MLLVVAGLATVAVAAPAARADLILGQHGRTGYSAAQEPAGCRYRVFPGRGVLTASTAPPVVKGVNLRRGRRDRSLVRYRVFFTVQHNDQTVDVSGWSGTLRVSDRRAVTWAGAPTAFDGDWRLGYYLDIRIEWWRRGRLLGWRAHRIDSYHYFNQYNAGPIGPLTWCAKVS